MTKLFHSTYLGYLLVRSRNDILYLKDLLSPLGYDELSDNIEELEAVDFTKCVLAREVQLGNFGEKNKHNSKPMQETPFI